MDGDPTGESSSNVNRNTDDMDESQASGNDVGETSQDAKTEAGAGGKGDSPRRTEGDGVEDYDREIVPYCLVCNSVRDKAQQLPPTEESRHHISAVESTPVEEHELKELVFVALNIEANEEADSPYLDPNYKLPLCSTCKYKCGQLKYISAKITELEREFNRIREAMALTICDVVWDQAHFHEYNDEKDPLREAREARQKEMNTIQEFVLENWYYIKKDQSSVLLPQPRDTLGLMKETVKNIRHIPLPSSKFSPKGNAHVQAPVPRPRNTTASMSFAPASLPKGFTTMPKRIRRSAADVQKERSEMIRRGIRIPNLAGGGFRNRTNAAAAGMTGFRKQIGQLHANSQNSGRSGIRGRPPKFQPSSSIPRIRPDGQMATGRKIIQQYQQPGREYNMSMPGLGQGGEDFDDFNENSTNDSMSMTGMSEDYEGDDGQLSDWNSNQNEQDYENLDQFEDMSGAGHFLEGGGHFMEGGYDDSESLGNIDEDDGPINDANDDIEYHQNEEGLYVCTFCNKQFIHKYPYRDHLKTHTGEGPKCDVCGKIFPKNHNLMLHMRTHTGEKPFSCEICKKGFADKSNLKVHMRVHTGERPYQCEECGESFVNSSRLVVHRRLHTGEQPICCDICQKAFATEEQLQSHRKNHFVSSNPKPKLTKPKRSSFTNVSHEAQSEVKQQQAQPQAVTVSSRSGRTIIPKRRV